MSFFAAYILRGRMQAMLVASTLALLSLKLPPVSIVSSAAISLVTLRKGAYEGLLVLLISGAAAAVLGNYLLGNFLFALGYSLVLWFPVWSISIVLREGRNLNLSLDMAVLLGGIIVAGFYLYLDNPAAMWNALINQMVEPVLSVSDVPVDKIKQSIALVSRYMTGVIAAGSVSGLMLGLLLARWWQAALFNPGGFRKEFAMLNTRPPLAIASLVILATALSDTGKIAEIAGNISILLFVLYAFIGTAVVHVLISVARAKRFLLPLFYLVIFIIPHALLPVALIGLADAWLNLRNKVANQTSV